MAFAYRRSRGTAGLPRELVDAAAADLVDMAGTTDAAIVTVVDPLASWVSERTTLFWVRTRVCCAQPEISFSSATKRRPLFRWKNYSDDHLGVDRDR